MFPKEKISRFKSDLHIRCGVLKEVKAHIEAGMSDGFIARNGDATGFGAPWSEGQGVNLVAELAGEGEKGCWRWGWGSGGG